MNTQIYTQLKDYMGDDPYSLNSIAEVVANYGSTWSKEQIELLLMCRDEVKQDGGQFCFQSKQEDPLTAFLLKHAEADAMPAAYLLRKVPNHLSTSARELCNIANNDPRFEVVRRTFIKKI